MFRFYILMVVACSVAAATEEASVRTYCTGTLVTNCDGTKSCVVQYGTCSSGYPVYQVTNYFTGVVTYTTQTGTNSNGGPVYSPCNSYCQVPSLPTFYCSGKLYVNADGSYTCSVACGVAPSGYTVYKNTVSTSSTVSYMTQTNTNSLGQPMYSPCNSYGQVLTTTSAPLTCSGTVVPNCDGTKTCAVKYGTASNGYPIYQLCHMTTGAYSYAVQTGTSSTGQYIYSTCNQYGQLLSPTYTCTGSLVVNNDGSKSCVNKVGTCSNGYPIYKVVNISTGAVTYVSQMGVTSCGQSIMTVTNQYCQPLAG